MKAQRKEDMDDKDEVEEYDKVLHDEGNKHENYSRVCSTLIHPLCTKPK